MVAKAGDKMKSTVPPGTPLIINSVKDGSSAPRESIQKPLTTQRRLDYIRQQFLSSRKAADGAGADTKSFVVEGKQCRSKSQPIRMSNGHDLGIEKERSDLGQRRVRRDEESRVMRREVRSSYHAPVALPVLSVGGPGFSHRLMSKSRSLPGDRGSEVDLEGMHLGAESDYLSESEACDTIISSKASTAPKKVSKRVNNFFPKPCQVGQEDFLDICVDTQKASKSPKLESRSMDLEMTRSKTINLSLNSENNKNRRSHSFRARAEGSPLTRSKSYKDSLQSHSNVSRKLLGSKYVEAIEIKVSMDDSDLHRSMDGGKPIPKKVVAKYSDIAIQKDLDDFFRVKPAFH